MGRRTDFLTVGQEKIVIGVYRCAAFLSATLILLKLTMPELATYSWLSAIVSLIFPVLAFLLYVFGVALFLFAVYLFEIIKILFGKS